MTSKLTNDHLSVFNRSDAVVESWYWALRSSDLKPGRATSVRLMGKDLALYRKKTGEVVALDAYCPHRGSHLGLGLVEGDGIRCGYHRWKYDESGTCVDVPCLDKPPSVGVNAYPVTEKYDLIWVYTGLEAKEPVPFCPPDLVGQDVAVAFAPAYVKGCHPNVVMCDAIDAQHFHSVHGFEGGMLEMKAEVVDDIYYRAVNVGRMPRTRLITRMLGWFYKDALTYALSYWYGHTGTVTVGPDFLRAHIMFANRVGPGGTCEGQTVCMTRRRPGPIGWLVTKAVLFLTFLVGAYFAKGDTPQFNTIQFDFKTPIKEDAALIGFIQHLEQQPTAAWGYGDVSGKRDPSEPTSKTEPRLRVVAE